MKQLERMRWRCRRGLLELDIVLGRFVDAWYLHLTAEEQRAFDALLELPDITLWALIAGGEDGQSGAQQALLVKIRAV